MKKTITLVLIIFAINLSATKYYLSPTGNDGNAGTMASPWYTLEQVWNVITPGDTVYLRGGTYAYNNMQYLQLKNGTPNNLINIWNYPGETPNITGTYQVVAGAEQDLIYLEGDYFYFKGIEVSNFAQQVGESAWSAFRCGFTNGSIFELLNIHHNGGCFQIRGNSGGNLILNCDFHHNQDPYSPIPYDGADGIVVGSNPGNGTAPNIIRGCRSYWNTDDGFDLWDNNGKVTIENCWSFFNGYIPGTFTPAGNGSGFKLGLTANHRTEHLRTVKNCVGFKNRSFGVVENAADCFSQIYNNTMVKNGYNEPDGGFSYWFGDWNGNQTPVVAKNNIHYKAPGVAWSQGLIPPGVDFSSNTDTVDHNSWQNSLLVSDADFQSLDSMQLLLPRKLDGSLPDITFLHLATGSDLIDAGVNVGLPYNASAPDLGAFEYVSQITTGLTQTKTSNEFILYPNPTTNELNIILNTTSPTTLIIKDKLGRVVRTIYVKSNTNLIAISTSDLANGIYFMSIINDDAIYKTEKFIKQ